MNNVFEGPDALRDFLDPGKHPNLPLVELPAQLNPFAADRIRIFAKLMGMSPLGNVKAFPAFNMIQQQHKSGALDGVDRIVENSSGNTVFSMALVARHFGIAATQSYVPSEISRNKLLMLQFFGIEPLVNVEPQAPDACDPASGVFKARKDGQAPDAINPGQYDNDDNPGAHEKWTGPQIWQQTDGKIDIFCAGLGTTGTLIGNARYLKAQNPDLHVLGVMRAPDNYVPGARTEKLLNLVGFNWRDHVDALARVETEISYRQSMAMSRLGLLAGPTSGMALAGLLQHLEALKSAGKLDEMRKAGRDELVCVFPCPDGPMPYLDEYFKYLDPSEFPEIQNENVLVNKA